MTSSPQPSRQAACLESSRIERFVRGLLPESEAEAVAAHADACVHCQQVLASLDREQSELVGRLQRGVNTPRPDDLKGRAGLDSLDETELLTGLPGTRRSDVSTPGFDMQQLMRRLEQLPRDTQATPTDWAEWARKTLGFGPNGPPGLPHYRLLAALGAGGMGVVLEVEDASLGRPIALKVLRPELAGNSSIRERFLTEAQAMAALRHDAIVRVFQTGSMAAGDLGSLPFLTMERLSGETLAQRLSRGPALTLPESLRISSDIARALAEAHRNGLVHRDVKPENVFLDGTVEQFRTKLLDFGLARAVSAGDQAGEQGWVLGTPAYMSPEQARGEPVTERTDLFSLGCVMYRMLSGRLPFDGDTSREMLRVRVEHSPVALQTLVPTLPEELTDLIDELLSGDVERRPESASNVVHRLERLAETHPEPDTGRAAGRPRWLAMCGMVAAIFMLIAMVAGLSGGWLRPLEDSAAVEYVSGEPTHAGGPVTLGGEPSGNIAPRSNSPGANGHSADNVPVTEPIEPLDSDWQRRVPMLAPDEQVAEVVAELKRRNPQWGGVVEFDADNSHVVRFQMSPPGLRDISPVRAFPYLKHLQFPAGEVRDGNPPGEVTDLSPLRGMPLSVLDCGNNPITDFSPLRGMPLTILRAKSTRVSDLSPLSELPLRVLQLAETPVEDLTPIKDCPLSLLSFWSTSVSDLSPLAGMTTLTRLECERTQVTDLTPLRGLKLKHLACQESPIEDYSVLASFPLEELHISYDPARHRELLRSIPTLQRINYRPAETILE